MHTVWINADWIQLLGIAAAVLVAGIGGWPVTAGILRLAKSDAVRAADAPSSPRADPDEEPWTDDTTDLPPPAGGRPGAPGPSEAPAALAAEGAAPPATVSVAAEALASGVLRGGLVIGLLERTAVVLAILTDQSVAIAYVVAIKGLGRYPELRQTPAASERFIIGTFSSMLWAAGVAILAKSLLL